MMDWFRSGGWGMFLALIIGAGAIGFGVKALSKPPAERLAMLRALPALLTFASLFTFGVNMWAVNQHVGSEVFLKANNITPAEAPVIAVLGITESVVQPFTLAGLLAMVVVALRMFAEAKKAQAERRARRAEAAPGKDHQGRMREVIDNPAAPWYLTPPRSTSTGA